MVGQHVRLTIPSTTMSTLMTRIGRLIDKDPKPRSVQELRGQLRSTARDTRLIALIRIRRQIENDRLLASYFTLARPLTMDRDSTCRWQATIILGEFIDRAPTRVWRVAKQLAKSKIADIRMASATVLMEHLFEKHPVRMAPLFLAELKLGNRHFAKAVASCWTFGTARTKRRIQQVIDEAKRQSNTGLQPTASRAKNSAGSNGISRPRRLKP